MTGDTSSTNKCSAEWELCRINEYPWRRRRSLDNKAAAESAPLCTLLSLVPRLSFTGGEDQSYFFNSWVAGSSPAGPKGNCSSMAEQRKHTLVAGSPVIVSLADNSPAGNLNSGAELLQLPLPQQQFQDVGTGFIGGEDQGYIACP
jgi:hypothetical protein